MRVAVWLVTAGCAAEPALAMTFQVVDQSRGASEILLEQQFPDYDSALTSAPLRVTISDGTASLELDIAPGVCEQFPCTGPVTAEYVGLGLAAPDETHVVAYTCIGLDGIHAFGGIDSSDRGACRR